MKRFAIETLALMASCACALAQQIGDEQRAAIRSACRNDYMNVCASVPTGGKESLQCLQQHSQQVSAGCRNALSPAAPAPAASSEAAAPAPSATAATAIAANATSTTAASAARPLTPREEAHVVRTDCGGDFQKFCPEVKLGSGRAAACLRANMPNLTPACRSALAAAAPQ